MRKLADRHKVGLVRAVRGMMSTAEQVDTLLDHGVAEPHIWSLDEYTTEDVIRAFRPVPGDDVLVVPFLGVLGKYRFEILAGIAPKGATLFDCEEHGELEISQAATFDIINKACATAQSAPGRAAVKEGVGRPGRRKSLTQAQERECKAWYESGVGSIAFGCDKFGVSSTWLHGRFGPRGDAIKAARKRKRGEK